MFVKAARHAFQSAPSPLEELERRFALRVDLCAFTGLSAQLCITGNVDDFAGHIHSAGVRYPTLHSNGGGPASPPAVLPPGDVQEQ